MPSNVSRGVPDSRDDALLRLLLEGTAAETGTAFFRALVENLAKALSTHGAWVTEYLPETGTLRALAFTMGGTWIEGWERTVAGTPCEVVLREERLVLFADRTLDLFPEADELRRVGAVSYLGVPLKDVDGRILGHLAVVDTRPMPEEPRSIALFQIFAARAAAELRRMRREAAVRAREEELARVFDGAMDAILELDGELRITRVNAAAGRTFERVSADLAGLPIERLLLPASFERLRSMLAGLKDRDGKRSLWIASGLDARSTTGRVLPLEGTVSRHAEGNESFHTLILRNVNDRIAAERKIATLDSEAGYLRQELEAAEGFGEIIGESRALADALRAVAQVADTDAAVLILGETGTGKELVARALHARSRRKGGPLVRLNCGAIPADLVESELFGHEKGAFTGATKSRIGRFELADGGTLFLDEVAELSPDLQVKLLRVLQEGEFEPVGSSTTRKVDVRVISATNRDLKDMVRAGGFREDLYYRLEVFPIRLPPLRERGDDVVLLARAFVERLSRARGRAVGSLSPECERRLREYDWPGNVRELQNVIERAVITSRDGVLDLERALSPSPRREPSPSPSEPIRTAEELADLERRNLTTALASCGWRVAGEGGAAERLGMKPTTLKSRMKSLGIVRPRE